MKNQKGFTLIELLAVIVILAIIAAIAIPAIGHIIKNSHIDGDKSDAVQVINAAKLYVSQKGIPSEALSITELDPYLDDEVNLSEISVSVTEDETTGKVTYALTANGKYVTFKNATLTDINNSPKGATEVPKK
ncbi:prepilin-type N-terminal cleavage/methylation domain-containing protein [Weizmannia coagulans]|nr:prepilin-type N-terminal cleavage/methylation domain-containing protein [Heyndrickxia coagulans]NWN92982.1 prepilin-type N-terminal cleavage/methylation domain-containing protein [Bacillus sp. (in: firmicutes)]UYT06526.1 prepilin-type N-terminal cleavage/methylation domain-containing protein [Weizmannia sp. WK01]MBT2236903.1 prepilin-type N-terminal cleavage/methylation domain-containing protein [Heyndrickxia coagulans]MCR4445074.1 prepilin-type N-terminal cleavage/methylation domain-contain